MNQKGSPRFAVEAGFAPILIILGIMLLLGVTGGAYYFGQSSVKVPALPQVSVPTLQTLISPTQPITKTIVSPTPAVDETVNWKTYIDSKNIFSFQYPTERIIQVTDLDVIIVKPVNVPTEKPNSPTDGPGDNRIISLYYSSLNGKILKDLVIEEYNKDKSGANNDKEVSAFILNKLSGYEYTIGGFRQQRVIYLKYKDDNFVVIMTSISPDEIAQKILSTFKFTN